MPTGGVKCIGMFTHVLRTRSNYLVRIQIPNESLSKHGSSKYSGGPIRYNSLMCWDPKPFGFKKRRPVDSLSWPLF